MSTSKQPTQSTALTVTTPSLMLPAQAAEHLFWISDSAMKQGVHIIGGPGSGKSTLLGRIIIWQALLRGLPTVAICPTGQVVNNVLDKISRLPVALGQALAKRIVYVDMANQTTIVPSPLYQRYSPNESYADIANRLIEVILEEDPELSSAPILGKNALVECASSSGQIASFLGLQIEFVYNLVKYPNRYADLLTYVVTQEPELERAANYFRELADPKNKTLHQHKTQAFLNKLHPFLSHKAMRAAFNAATPSIDWADVAHNGQTVLLDFSQVWNKDRRPFLLLWWLKDFTTFIKHRGAAGRGQEMLFVIDEITQLLGYKKVNGESILAQEVEELTTVLGRNFGVNLVIAHQNLGQLDERIQTALMQMGNQLIGKLANPNEALLIARYFRTYKPHWTRKVEWHLAITDEQSAADLDPRGLTRGGKPYDWSSHRKLMFPTGSTSTEYTTDEQYIMLADKIRNLKRFIWYVRPALAEGQIDTHLYKISLENLDKGEYPDVNALSRLKDYLRQQSGQPVDTVLAEMAAHTRQVLKAAKQARVASSKAKEKALAIDDTIGATVHDTTSNPVPRTTPAPGAASDGAPAGETPHLEEERIIL